MKRRIFNIPLPKDYDLSADMPIDLTRGWKLKATGVSGSVREQYIKRLHLNSEGDKSVVLNIGDMPEESYEIGLQPDVITVTAGSEQGLRYALYTLLDTSSSLELPAGTITDSPLLGMRGYMLNVSSMEKMDINELLTMVKWAAEAKLNTLLIEYNSRFPYKGYPDILSPFALSTDEVRLLVSTAEEYGMEVIPLMQTFGHLEYFLKDPSLHGIREIGDRPSQLCPRNPDSLEFVKSAIDEYCELHPNSRYIHLGGDETRQLGKCPRCAEFVRDHGVARLYAEYMNRVIDYVCSKGLTPLVYDDMLCAHPETMKLLDKRVVIVYWDYWCTAPKNPILVARYGKAPVIAYDRRWDNGTWEHDTSELSRRILRIFGDGNGCEDLEASLGGDFMKEFGYCLGPDFPKYFKAFPYLEYYMDHGFRVIGMPTSLGNTDNYLGMPNQARFTSNIRICCERAAEAGAMGVITSAWYSFPSPLYPLGISTAGFYSWGLPDYAPSIPDWRK